MIGKVVVVMGKVVVVMAFALKWLEVGGRGSDWKIGGCDGSCLDWGWK